MKRNSSGDIPKLLAALLLVLLLGTLGYSLIEEDWSLLDALYMTVITITTIGFGEIRELSSLGRIFTILIIILGLGLAASLIARLGQIVVASGINNLYWRRKMTDRVKTFRNHYIICGYGRIGSSIARKLNESQIDFVVIDNDPENIETAGNLGYAVLEGDASQDATLLEAGIQRAKGTVLCVRNDGTNVNIALAARELNGEQHIISRGSDPSIEYRLVRAGADTVVYPMRLGGEQIARIIADEYDKALEDQQAGAPSVLGYELQLFKNLDAEKTVRAILEERQAVRPVAIRRTDGSMDHNPLPDAKVAVDEDLLLLVNEERNNRSPAEKRLIEWSEQLELNHQRIDEDHRRIVAAASRLQKAAVDQGSQDAVPRLFDRLLSSLEKHHRREEDMMTSATYPKAAEHRQAHRDMITLIRDLNRDRRYRFAPETWTTLDNALADHFLITDRAFITHLAEKKARENDDKAVSRIFKRG